MTTPHVHPDAISTLPRATLEKEYRRLYADVLTYSDLAVRAIDRRKESR